jgi:uncharacterized protein
MLFGLLHAALLWEGDILFAYALLGMVLPLLRRASARIIAGFAIFALLLSVLLALPGPGQGLHAAYESWINPPLSAYLGLPGHIRWMASIPLHLSIYLWKLAYFPDWLGNFAALILFGYLAGQSRIKTSRRLWSVLVLALTLNLFYALASVEPRLLPVDWAGFLRTAALSLGGPLLALAYAQGIIRIYHAPRGGVLLDPLRLLGRMPLTTYLIQSLVGALLFTHTVPGRFAPALVWPLAGLIFLAQLLFARWWLARNKRGPVEMTWRWLSGEVESS